MSGTAVAFPHLKIFLENVPKNFTVFGFTIALYGVIIAIGLFAGILVATHDAKKLGQNPDDYWDFVIYAIIFSLICGRLYYVIFSWDSYKNNLLEIFNVRNGGMAIYGAVIGAFATLFIFCKIKKKNPFLMGDSAVLGLLVGQIIGRWGNFFNRECFGGYTDNFLAMQLPISAVRRNEITPEIWKHVETGVNYIQVHPTFLYEGLWNLIVFVLLKLFGKHKKFDGEIMLGYLGGYGLGRCLIEGLRTDQLLIPGTSLAVSQILGGVLFIGSVVCDIFIRVKLKNKAEIEKNINEAIAVSEEKSNSHETETVTETAAETETVTENETE